MPNYYAQTHSPSFTRGDSQQYRLFGLLTYSSFSLLYLHQSKPSGVFFLACFHGFCLLSTWIHGSWPRRRRRKTSHSYNIPYKIFEKCGNYIVSTYLILSRRYVPRENITQKVKVIAYCCKLYGIRYTTAVVCFLWHIALVYVRRYNINDHSTDCVIIADRNV